MEIKFINRSNNSVEIERPPGEKLLNFLYHNLLGERLILPIAKQKFISELYGKRMDSPRSKKRIEPFVKSLKIDMSEAQKQIGEFETFNDFFYRKLKPGARPIEEGLVSPGDGRLLAFENISELSTFFVKGKTFTLKEFLRNDTLAEEHANSSMVILRLAPNDYHRYHFPYDGVPTQTEEIKGVYYSVSPISVKEKFTEVFTENKKEVCKLKTTERGEILIIPVGATMVGSLNSTFEADKSVKKGEEMGYFAFGGSTVVLLFNSKSFELDKDLIENTKNNLETYVKMGEKIGTAL
ncbi:phosphatidylserine decarboxylase [Marivirga sericea]|uniref:Phosphatidylserine decarboxylase proenzyme n=1 Tax=Marivirga sericea TaxID=1028 RepID=A0A1X7I2S8_9BACT|nr:archaetidylserine decarboxylase [Marivirga sericea]SMG07986.1 phosphatidylserine decarboxylase [Marivirga sericea]